MARNKKNNFTNKKKRLCKPSSHSDVLFAENKGDGTKTNIFVK